MPVAGSTRCTGARSHSPRPAAVTPPRLPTAIVRAVRPCSASAPSTASSATQWLPMITRSGSAALSPISVTRAVVPASSAGASASISMKPSACEKLVTAPEPLTVGNATGPCSPATSATSTNSLRPSSEAMRTGTSRVERARRFRRQPGAGADHRRDEGVEGEDRRGRKARQHRDRLAVRDREAERLARLERDAMHEDAGRAEARHYADGRDRRRPSRCRRRAAPCRRRRAPSRTAAASAASSSGNAPKAIGSPPASATAAAMIAPLLS